MNYNESNDYDSFGNDTLLIDARQNKKVMRGLGCFFWILLSPFMMAGLIFIIVGISQYKVACDKEKVCTDMIKGIVTSKIVKEDDVYGYSVQYEGPLLLKYTYNRKVYIVNDSDIENSKSFEIDDEIDIYVDPAKPDNYYVPYYNNQAKNGWKELIIVSSTWSFLFALVFVIAKIKPRKNKSEEYS
ncbi:MAG: hypothetical protein J6Y64_00260 [Ruminococcus sp.]|nr:hypothetical protein [Ruminococcus sp.]